MPEDTTRRVQCETESCGSKTRELPDLSALSERLSSSKRCRILVTDLGVGGLSVLSALDATLRERGDASTLGAPVELVYYDCHADSRPRVKFHGYHEAKQVEVFDACLAGMLAFDPDVILIACNTLSVLYPKTTFAATSSVPVLDIVTFGVHALQTRLLESDSAAALVFGTLTTARSGAHRQGLAAAGVDPARVVLQGCAILPGAIHYYGPESKEVAEDIPKVVESALELLAGQLLLGTPPPPPPPLSPQADTTADAAAGAGSSDTSKVVTEVYAALCCTHFGFAAPVWESALATGLAAAGHDPATVRAVVVNPNQLMADAVLEALAPGLAAGGGADSVSATASDVSVIAVAKCDNGANVSSLRKYLSPAVYDAMLGLKVDADLFHHPLVDDIDAEDDAAAA